MHPGSRWKWMGAEVGVDGPDALGLGNRFIRPWPWMQPLSWALILLPHESQQFSGVFQLAGASRQLSLAAKGLWSVVLPHIGMTWVGFSAWTSSVLSQCNQTFFSSFGETICFCLLGFLLWKPRRHSVQETFVEGKLPCFCFRFLADTEVIFLFVLQRHYKCSSEWISACSCEISSSSKWTTW